MIAQSDHPVLIATISAAALIVVSIVQNWRNLRKSDEVQAVASDTNKVASTTRDAVDGNTAKLDLMQEQLDRIDARLEVVEVNQARKARRRKPTEGGS